VTDVSFVAHTSHRHCERSDCVRRSLGEGGSNPEATRKNWIASSQELLAMTELTSRTTFVTPEAALPDRAHTTNTVDPVVLRAARSAWARAASFKG
jgi:hypothetical protein